MHAGFGSCFKRTPFGLRSHKISLCSFGNVFCFLPSCVKNPAYRTVLMVALLLLGGPAQLRVQAQRGDPTPRESATLFKQADQVVIYTNDSLSVARHRIAVALQANGFVVDTVLATLVQTQITVLPRTFGVAKPARSEAFAYLRTRGAGTLIILEGFCLADADIIPRRKVKMKDSVYQGAQRGCQKAAFRQLEAVARAYPGGRLSYRAGMSRND